MIKGFDYYLNKVKESKRNKEALKNQLAQAIEDLNDAEAHCIKSSLLAQIDGLRKELNKF